MSRGRKPKGKVQNSDWGTIFNRNVGYYFQTILIELGARSETKTDKTESGQFLLEQIRTSIKPKKYPNIEKDEIPFKIPEHWVWCKLGEICSKIGSGSTPNGSNYAQEGFPFFRSQNIHNEGLVYDDIKFVSPAIQKQMKGTSVFANDILLNITGGSMGRCAHVPNEFTEGNVSQHVCIIRPFGVNNEFFHKLILTPYFQDNIFSSTTGAGREGLPKYNLEQFIVPLPSLPEQNSIVRFLKDFEINNLESGISYFDIDVENKVIAHHKSQLAGSSIASELTHQLSLVQKLRQQFLQEAVQGKLVPQDPSDEPASVLLQKIKAEKERLVKEKIIKKDKNLPEIKSEEIPFEVSEGWVWCRLGKITNFIDYRGKTPNKTKQGVKLITAKNVKVGYFSNTPEEFISEKDYIRHMTRGIPNNGDVLFTTEAPLGNACLLNQLDKFALAQRIITIQPLLFYNYYLLFVLMSSVIQKQLISKQSGATAKGIKSSRLIEILIPLPPLPEQHRIVQKLEQLLQACDALQASIQESRGYNEQLLQQVLREALK